MIVKILYYILILPISFLPYNIIYFISDIIFFIIYKIIRYRKDVVLINLKNSFPDKGEIELKKIMNEFYRHLSDIIMESIKGFTVSKSEIKNRVLFKNPELINSFAANGQSIIVVTGHYNNWEMCAQAFPMNSDHQCITIYKSLANRFLDKKIYNSRSRFGLGLVAMQKIRGSFFKSSNPKAIVFVSDQNPSNTKRAHWLQFLNQDTAVAFGAEKYAKEYNLPVVYASISKLNRGFYQVEYFLVTDTSENQSNGKITESFTERLENDIINQPQYWLWSHKRWKHKR
tara:strand:+ start:85 stop:942 length:858 start_codon:yes stop_codon:yes gene_type:complete